MPPKSRCIVVLIHGVGDQKKSWSQEFRQALRKELGSAAARTKLVDAFWAELSKVKDAFRRTLAAAPVDTTGVALEDEAYRRAALEFSRMLAAEAGAPVGAVGFGPVDVFAWIRGKLEGAQELVVDVGNYVARNGVRTAVQNVLHTAIGQAVAERPDDPVILVSHSQGTVISYDVLRQAGTNYRNLRTWITMGSPLRKYFAFPLQWGKEQLGMPPNVRWLNLYDTQDLVGKDLAGAVAWPQPQPDDRVVDNKKNAKDAHDHWHNPQVVKAVADEIRVLL